MVEALMLVAFFGALLVLDFALWASTIAQCFKHRLIAEEGANLWLTLSFAVLGVVTIVKVLPTVYAVGERMASIAAEDGTVNWFTPTLVLYPVALVYAIVKFAPKLYPAFNWK